MKQHVWFAAWSWDIKADGTFDKTKKFQVFNIDPRPSEHLIVVGEADAEIVFYPKVDAVAQQIAGLEDKKDRLAENYYAERRQIDEKIQDLQAISYVPTPVPDDGMPF